MNKKILLETDTHIEYAWDEGDKEAQKSCRHQPLKGLVSERYTTDNGSHIATIECTICNIKFYRELARKDGLPL